MGDKEQAGHLAFPKLNEALKGLARIRCLEACIDNLNEDLTLPPPLVYMPTSLFLSTHSATDLPLFRNPVLTSFIRFMRFSSRHIAHVNGNMQFNKDGVWVQLIKITLEERPIELENASKLWILLCNFNSSNALFAPLVPYAGTDEEKYVDEHLIVESNWMEMVERCFLPFGIKDKRAESVVSSSPSLTIPSSQPWSMEHDNQICQLLSKHSVINNIQETLLESFKVSKSALNCLLTCNPADSWYPNDCPDLLEQYIEIELKPLVYIERLGLMIGKTFTSQVYCGVVVTGGTIGKMEVLYAKKPAIDFPFPGEQWWLLQKQTSYLRTIRITFTPNSGGTDMISGLLLIPQKSEYNCFNFYNSSALSPYPKLQDVSADILCRRSVMLERVVHLYDSCLPLLFPNWNLNGSSSLSRKFDQNLHHHVLSVSTLRKEIAKSILEKSESAIISLGTVTINRQLESESIKKIIRPNESVFHQIFTQVKLFFKGHNYRFPKSTERWWICNFVNENISDGGGGFRDSMTNIGEELCPTSGSDREPLSSLFIQSPNQRNPDEHDGETYIPNSSCKEFELYKWIGNLMGGCFRTEQNIAFSFPKFFWKMFLGCDVTWKDYSSVDQKEVNDLALMEEIDKAMFDDYFLNTRSWSHVLSNGTLIELKKGGEDVMLQYEDRLEYIKLVKEARLKEFNAQVDALREGFFDSVPHSVIHLFSIEEIEEMVCGKPTVSIEDLKKHVALHDTIDKKQIEFFWNVMENFTDEERCNFLKFVSGRKRLPVFLKVIPEWNTLDALPKSSTCASIFILPEYSSFEKALTMIRCAINSCQTIFD